MGLLTMVLGGRGLARASSTLSYPNAELVAALRGSVSTHAGVSVTPQSAMGYSAVVSAVRVLSESVAQLPLILYERVGDDGRRRAPEHPIYGLLHDAPNFVQDSFMFWDLVLQHLIFWGNFYAEMEVTAGGEITALWPLNPRYMDVVVADGHVRYVYRQFGRDEVWPVFHVRGMAKDAVKGQSLLSAARQAIGLGMAAEEFGARLFENGAVPGVALSHPGLLSEEARDHLKRSWEDAYSGLSNAHRVAVLEEGLTVERIGIPPDDAQFLETRKFQVTEIARIFRVPPHMLADLERATFSNIEHQSLEFVVHSLGPWLKRIETAIRVQLLDSRERDRFYAEFLVDGLLRGDIKARYAAYATGRQWGWLSRNDVRRFENMNPVPGGDDYLTPMNMMVIGEAALLDGQRENGGERSEVSGWGAREREGERGEALPRAAVVRHRLAGRYVRVIEDVAQRLVNREVNDVGNAARRLLASGKSPRHEAGRGVAEEQDFVDWLRDFYDRDGFAAVIREYVSPVFVSYLELVLDAVSEETGEDVGQGALDDWMDRYLRSRANIWCKEHRLALGRAVEEAQGDGSPDAVLAAVEDRLAQMKERDAGQWGWDQAHRFNNAAAVTAYGMLARTLKRWVAFGDSCPYCSQMDGHVVGIEMTFLGPGESLEDGKGGVYTTRSHVMHAPLHDGCDCMVISA